MLDSQDSGLGTTATGNYQFFDQVLGVTVEDPYAEWCGGVISNPVEDGYPINNIDDWARNMTDATGLGDQGLLLMGEDAEMSSGPNDSIMTGATTPEVPLDDRFVCYGMLYRVTAKLVGEGTTLHNELTPADGASNHIQKFTLEPETDHILLKFPNGTKFGYLKDQMTRALSPLLSWDDLLFEAVAPSNDLRMRLTKVGSSKDAIVSVDINIYGPPGKAKTVGDELSGHKAWLQRPEWYIQQYPYENPQVIKFPEIESTIRLEDINTEASTAKRRTRDDVLQMVSEVQASTHRADRLERTRGDHRLHTTLLEHQERALSFMEQRESGDIPEEFRLWKSAVVDERQIFVHRITKTRCAIRPEENGGGILADEMGMGKTLSIIALVIKTIEEAHQWAEKSRLEEYSHSKIKQYTHSTLVIVPSALLINGWLEEINIHLKDTLKVVKYHGLGRERDLEALSRSDIVLTTYHTLATDAVTKKSPLHNMAWFRVVLDEAHMIRRTTTTFHRTCADLNARSRWCLTGTPIQNRLEDIGALFVFLKAEPFHNLNQFRKFLVVPFEMGDHIAKERLVMLYDSLVLRRTKDILHLPGHEIKLRKLKLSPEERVQYNHTTNILDRFIRQQVGEHEIRSKFGLFQAHLQLRILCNHGTHQKLFSWRQRSLRDEKEATLVELGLNAERQCDVCRQPRPIINSTKARNDFIEKCTHVLCEECIQDYEGSQGNAGTLRNCPLCQTFGLSLQQASSQASDYSLDTNGDVMMQGIGDGDRDVESEDDDYFNPVGHSTKMNALVEDLKRVLDETVRDEDGTSRKTKSIVFSIWTRTLDLIERYLKKEKIDFLRIDGDCLLSKRQRILNQFARPGGARVMLMTTGTGAFGLNLTAANRIFIVELQWNPSVENQAIARAIRLRQRDKVVVTRYMMRGTVEQEMLSQQKKKKLAAQIGFVRAEALEAEAEADEEEPVDSASE